MPHIVNGDDIWMIEGGDGAGFLLKALQAGRIAGHFGGQDLQRHIAPQP
jgi:hypothetical protein